MDTKYIRNILIVNNKQYGKSELIERLIEFCNRSMGYGEGICIPDMPGSHIVDKGQPVQLHYKYRNGEVYELNFIEIPAQVGFHCEWSADWAQDVYSSPFTCEGGLLLIDSCSVSKRQILADMNLVLAHGLVLIPVLIEKSGESINKERIIEDLECISGYDMANTVFVSDESGLNVEAVLQKIVEQVPPPLDNSRKPFRGFIFNSVLDPSRRALAHIRVVDGEIKAGMKTRMMASGKVCTVSEVGHFLPFPAAVDILCCGSIGYAAANMENIQDWEIGDTVVDSENNTLTALPGYVKAAKPTIFLGLFPIVKQGNPVKMGTNHEHEEVYDKLEKLCYDRAHAVYGAPLPEIVKDRLRLELKFIQDNGYSTIFYTAHKLVKYSNDGGHPVGIRDSLGSSFVAFMSGITEINPLPSHYVCPKCHWNHFYTDGSVGSGFDLPDHNCPECGTSLYKDGHNIPCSVLFGLDGTNIKGFGLVFVQDAGLDEVYKYMEKLLGREHVLCYGDKLIPGSEKFLKYPDVCKCLNAKDRRWSANGNVRFNYHSIMDDMLSLTLNGNDALTMVHELQNLTGINPQSIPFNDARALSVFCSTDALGITPSKLADVIVNGKVTVGTLGLPGYGTPFARGVLEDVQPKNFSELVKVSGFRHGTGVWVNNARDLIKNDTVKIEEVISTREDVMNYLVHHGVESLTSFTVMENVRKGKGIESKRSNYLAELEAAHVPQWFIDSCLKIRYLPPKAPSIFSAMTALRIAWFKVYQPLAYYAAYFTVYAGGAFNATVILNGLASQKQELARIAALKHLTAVDKDNAAMIEVAAEMYLRGMEFLPISLEKSEATAFKIEDGKLLPPFNCIPALGNAAAGEIVKVRNEHLFTSKADLKKRGKVSQSIIDTMEYMGILKGLPEGN